jgi:hypothetical protein
MLARKRGKLIRRQIVNASDLYDVAFIIILETQIGVPLAVKDGLILFVVDFRAKDILVEFRSERLDSSFDKFS